MSFRENITNLSLHYEISMTNDLTNCIHYCHQVFKNKSLHVMYAVTNHLHSFYVPLEWFVRLFLDKIGYFVKRLRRGCLYTILISTVIFSTYYHNLHFLSSPITSRKKPSVTSLGLVLREHLIKIKRWLAYWYSNLFILHSRRILNPQRCRSMFLVQPELKKKTWAEHMWKQEV